MKTGIHPESREVVFVDRAADYVLKVISTVATKDTFEHDGTTYPCVFIELSSASHPYYTGEQRLLKTGAVDKFYARQKKMEALKKNK
jgi:large subunit ribosomal protein L31